MNMSRTYTVTEYTNQDIKELEYMDFETVLQQLDRIKCGYLPSGWRYPSANPERVFTAKEYDATVLRQSINIAMALVRGTGTCETIPCAYKTPVYRRNLRAAS